jgi:hypothetical protein
MNQNVAVALAIGLAGCSAAPSLPNPMSHLSMAVTPSAPAPNSIEAEVGRPWHHVEGPVSDVKFEQDKDKCALNARQAPAGVRTSETKFLDAFVTCMRAEGYAPVPDEDDKEKGRSVTP